LLSIAGPVAKEIADLRKRGVDVIVLDHQAEVSIARLRCDLKPKTSDSVFEYLCSVGIVFKLCHALLKTTTA
jgi:single-stranded DNA-specific DHH superfamily exonuclease